MTGGRRRLSVQVVLVLCFILVAGLGIGFIAVQGYLWLTGQLEQEDREQELALARAVAAGLERYMIHRVHFIETLAQEVSRRGLRDTRGLDALLETAKLRELSFSTLLVTDRAGAAIAFFPPVDAEGRPNVGRRYADRQWFLDVTTGAPRPSFDVIVGRAVQRPTVAVAAPIKSAMGEVIGVLAGALDLGTLRNMNRDIDPARSGRLVVTDSRGRVIAHSSTEWETQARDLSGTAVFQAARRQAEGMTRYAYQSTGGVRTAAYVRMPSTGWVVWASRPLEEEQAKLWSLLWNLVLSAAGAFAVAAVAAVLVSRALSLPLRTLAEASRRVAAGRLTDGDLLSRRDSSIREFSELLTGFGQMTDALRVQYEELEAKVAERTRELAQVAREAQEAAARLARQEEIGRGYGELAALLNSLDRSHILQEGTRKIAASLHAPVAAVYLTEDGPESLRLKTYSALDAASLDAGLLSAQGLPAEVARRRESVVVAAPAGVEALRLRTGVGELAVAAVAGLPLVHQQRLMGVLVVALLEPLTEDTRGFLENAARQLSVALSNAGLFESTRYQSQQMEQLNQALRQASEAKSRFLSSMSHELRTPMNGILGFTDILLMSSREPLTERQRTALEKVRGSGRHLLGLINQVLDLSKIEAGRVEVRPEAAALAAVVAECLAAVEPQAQTKQLALRAVGLEQAPEVVQDRQMVKQIILNLLSNAVKFTSTGGVEVRVVPESDGWVSVAVADTGVGIRPEDQAAIFEEFRQVESSGAEPASGTGLGLAIARRLAELLGGTLTVRSAPGEGSVFTLRLPVRFGRPRPREAVGGVKAPAPGTARVLVIEDDRNAVEIIHEAVADDALDVVWASDVRAGLEQARSLRPDLILLDVMMQGADDGWEVLKALKSDPATRGIPVILHSVIDNSERALRLGAAAVLAKPASPPAIRALIARILDRAATGAPDRAS